MGKERTWEMKFWNHINISFLNKLLIQKENKGGNSETTFSDHKATKPKINKMRKILFCL